MTPREASETKAAWPWYDMAKLREELRFNEVLRSVGANPGELVAGILYDKIGVKPRSPAPDKPPYWRYRAIENYMQGRDAFL